MSNATSSAKLKEFIVDHLNIGVFSVDKQMNLLLWNGFMENNSHRSADEVIGKNLFEMFPELPKKWLQRKIKSVFILKNFAFSSWEQRPFLFKFSHNRPITGGIDSMRQDLMLMPVKGDTGEVEAVNIVLLDMTDVCIFQGMMAETMEQMETLDDIVKTINRETQLENLLTTVLDQGLMLFPQADNGICWLLDAHDNRFKCAAFVNSAIFSASEFGASHALTLDDSIKTLSFDYDDLVARYTQNSECLEEGVYILRHFDSIALGEQLKNIATQKCSLSMAVTIEEQLIGFLVFSNFADKEAFANSDVQKLVRFREHSMSAISKAKYLKAIAEEGDKIKNLLDNAGQGFLSFTADLKVEGEYSAECRELFDSQIEGRPFPELIFADDTPQQQFLTSILQDIFTAPDNNELFLSLLPQETLLGGKNISIEYRPIAATESVDTKMMVILTDITETRMLENQMEEERNWLRMVVSAVTRRNEIARAIREYQLFCQQGLDQILNSNANIDAIIFEVFRMVHTFKGGFSQLDLVHVVKEIHTFESQLSDLRSRPEPMGLDEFKQLCADAPMWCWMEPDLTILKEALGEDFLGQEEMLTIGVNKVNAIEQQMLSTLSPIENQVFLPKLRRLKAKPFKALLKDYGDYIERLAEELDKAIVPMEITGDDVLVNPDEFLDFTKSLVHVFRNIMDHGIETIEDRMELGKDECGLVSCDIGHEDNQITLRISDDGNGIDVESLRQKTIDIGLYDSSQANDLNDEQLIELIFTEQISSKDSVNELSGRGIGLSAVKQELTKCGGTVRVDTELGVGTSFYFCLPFNETIELPAVDVELVVSAVIDQAVSFLTNEAAINCQNSPSSPTPYQSENLSLNYLTTMIRIKGLLEGVFLFSFDENLAKAVVRTMMLDDCDDESAYLTEVMAESCNIILGNSMNNFPGITELVMMDVPMSLNTRTSILENMCVEIWTSLIKTSEGNVSISFLPSS